MAEGSTDLVVRDGAQALQLALELGATLEPTGLTLSGPELTYENWEQLGRAIDIFGNAWQWWVGDWLNFGEALFGEDSAQAVDGDPQSRYDVAHRVTSLEVGSLMNIRSVCAKVAKSRRRGELRYSHHVVVASLEPDEQTEWLQRAITNGWTRDELRSELKAALDPPADPAPEPGAGGDNKTPSERIEEAARLVYRQAQPAGDGEYRVSAEAMVQLGAALGEGE